jgi:hypothetical protein
MAQIFVAPVNHSLVVLAKQHLQNPGRLYNDGNLVALAGAISYCAISAQLKGAATLSELKVFFFGSWPALFTTLAVIIFFISGKKYADAWAKGFPPNENLNTQGHALSTIGAVLVGFGLIGLSQNIFSLVLAVITTLLHAGGKFGSWTRMGHDAFFKTLPLLSRATYVASLSWDIATIVTQNSYGTDMIVQMLFPAALICAAALWSRADWLLWE